MPTQPRSDEAEEWRDVPGWEGRYRVSDLGNVFSVRAGRNLRLNRRPRGYRSALLCSKGRQSAVYVHRLVLLAFVGEPPPMMQCRHLNGNATDNRLCNLAWGTRKQNEADKVSHGTRARGERQGTAKLRDCDILPILESSESASALAARYGVSVGTINGLRCGCRWKHVTQNVSRRDRRTTSDAHRGERNRNARLTRESVLEILSSTETTASLARRLGVAEPTIADVRAGRTWRHLKGSQ